MTGAAARPYDLVLLGASGFTGGLTARALARRAPENARWALAGRDEGRLRELRAELSGPKPVCEAVGIVHADLRDHASLHALAQSTRVVATAAGPYTGLGEDLAGACAQAGTDYLDISGEAEFVDRVYADHHARAIRTGARLVHCCGFDSIPYDLGAYLVYRSLPRDAPMRVRATVQLGDGASLRGALTLSPGSLRSAVTMLSRRGHRRRAASARRGLEATDGPPPRSVRAPPMRVRREPSTGGWALPLRTLDAVVVRRSAAAIDPAAAPLSFGIWLAVPGMRALARPAGAVAAAFALAQWGPTRRALLRQIESRKAPGPDVRARGRFRICFTGRGGGETVLCEVSGGDPGYEETATMFAEAALCLAFDELQPRAGQVTPAAAMAEPLLARLAAVGVHFRVANQKMPRED